MNVSLQMFVGNGMLRRREFLQDCFRVANVPLNQDWWSTHVGSQRAQKVSKRYFIIPPLMPSSSWPHCMQKARKSLRPRKAMFDRMYRRKHPRKKDKGQHTEHSTKSDLETYGILWFSLGSFELLMSEICFTSFWNTWIGSLTPQISKILESRTVCSYCICWPEGRKHHLFFAMLRWILLPLAVAMSDDAECDSPGMMQLKGIPSHQGNQPRGRRKFTPDVWAPKFETSNNETSTTLQMACQGVAWFTLMIIVSLASPTL